MTAGLTCPSTTTPWALVRLNKQVSGAGIWHSTGKVSLKGASFVRNTVTFVSSVLNNTVLWVGASARILTSILTAMVDGWLADERLPLRGNAISISPFVALASVGAMVDVQSRGCAVCC